MQSLSSGTECCLNLDSSLLFGAKCAHQVGRAGGLILICVTLSRLSRGTAHLWPDDLLGGFKRITLTSAPRAPADWKLLLLPLFSVKSFPHILRHTSSHQKVWLGSNKAPQSVKPHHSPGPAVNHLCEPKLELAYKLLSRLRYPTLPLQLSDALSHRLHLLDALVEKNDKIGMLSSAGGRIWSCRYKWLALPPLSVDIMNLLYKPRRCTSDLLVSALLLKSSLIQAAIKLLRV